jgi:hypothetical protein
LLVTVLVAVVVLGLTGVTFFVAGLTGVGAALVVVVVAAGFRIAPGFGTEDVFGGSADFVVADGTDFTPVVFGGGTDFLGGPAIFF